MPFVQLNKSICTVRTVSFELLLKQIFSIKKIPISVFSEVILMKKMCLKLRIHMCFQNEKRSSRPKLVPTENKDFVKIKNSDGCILA
jgi:hypothetical protein